MQSVFTDSGIVIVANDINLSIFKPPWLTKVGIFKPEELQENIVITPPFVQIKTEDFEVTILANRIQMTIRQKYPKTEEDISRILGGIVETLPHTPYTAVGLNFNYLLAPDDLSSFYLWNRKLFASDLSNQIVSTDEKTARFGSYFSYDVLGTRLKIDIKPAKAEPIIKNLCENWEPGQDLLKIHFNFYSAVSESEKPEDSVIEALGKWAKALSISKETVGQISN